MTPSRGGNRCMECGFREPVNPIIQEPCLPWFSAVCINSPSQVPYTTPLFGILAKIYHSNYLGELVRPHHCVHCINYTKSHPNPAPPCRTNSRKMAHQKLQFTHLCAPYSSHDRPTLLRYKHDHIPLLAHAAFSTYDRAHRNPRHVQAIAGRCSHHRI